VSIWETKVREGLITYMRTDSVAVSKEAQAEAREYIVERFGSDYTPENPRTTRHAPKALRKPMKPSAQRRCATHRTR
jgi:DNA topoisomerase IA